MISRLPLLVWESALATAYSSCRGIDARNGCMRGCSIGAMNLDCEATKGRIGSADKSAEERMTAKGSWPQACIITQPTQKPTRVATSARALSFHMAPGGLRRSKTKGSDRPVQSL